MGPDRITFATTLPVRGAAGSEPAPVRAAAIDAEPGGRPGAGAVVLTSGLSFACRYCGRSHYPSCR